MPKVKSRLTSKEQKCLIDFDEISPERHDFALMLLCSRSLYRIQLRCFEHNVLNIQDICDIVKREVDRLPQLLSVIGASLEANGSYNVNHHENLMMLDFCKKITNSNDPLDIIRGLLTAEQNSRSLKSSSDKKVKKMYRNLINLIDDLKKFMQNRNSTDDSTNSSSTNTTRKRNNFRPVYFMGNYCVCTEGVPGSGEETFIHPPTALLWLPVLTNKERITQHTTSAFSLRKKTEFAKNNGPSFRPQLLRMNFVQTFGRRQSQQSTNTTKSLSGEKSCRVTNNSSSQQSIQLATTTSNMSSNIVATTTSNMSSNNVATTTSNMSSNIVATTTSYMTPVQSPITSSCNCNCSPLSATYDFRKLCPCIVNMSAKSTSSSQGFSSSSNNQFNSSNNQFNSSNNQFNSSNNQFNSNNNPLLSPPLFTVGGFDFPSSNSRYTSTRNYSYGYNSTNYDGLSLS
ncbi:6167_t:CDS:2, partial [Dentiscutata heterogama]